MQLKDYIRTVADFPKPGILYRDITSLLKSAEAFSRVIEQFRLRYIDAKID
ncbi:MAG: adenine phosphoribosyltransferase, partial [Proteobacteria bacterium]|nr:adenine phosphoribosyltransferase [Pseudomonadota bacterium]